jgi:hypothetical protein
MGAGFNLSGFTTLNALGAMAAAGGGGGGARHMRPPRPQRMDASLYMVWCCSAAVHVYVCVDVVR